MRLPKNRQNLVSIALLALLLTLALPGTAFAKRDKGQGRDDDKRDRKCGKFVNCHDARDGRWDGRGPRRDRDRRDWNRRDWDRRDWNGRDRDRRDWNGRDWDRRDRDGRDWDRRDWNARDWDRRDWNGRRDRRDWSRSDRHDRWDRRRSRFHNRNDRRFDALEINRTNTARFRRARG